MQTEAYKKLLNSPIDNGATIRDLKQRGFRIEIKHFRHGPTRQFVPANFFTEAKNNGFNVNPRPRGGKTVAYVIDPKGKIYKGETICGFGDTFIRKIGTHLALENAAQAIKTNLLNCIHEKANQ